MPNLHFRTENQVEGVERAIWGCHETFILDLNSSICNGISRVKFSRSASGRVNEVNEVNKLSITFFLKNILLFFLFFAKSFFY